MKRGSGPRAAGFAVMLALAGCGQRSHESASDAGSGGALVDVDPDSPVGQGYLAVQARRCGDCHEPPDPRTGTLAGQTAPVGTTQAYGSNLTPDPDTGMDAWDAGSIAASVLQGIDERGRPLCGAMPAYATYGMSEDEARSIAAYLQTLAPVWHPVPPSVCPPLKSAPDAGGGDP